MSRDELLEHVRRQPFVPFRLTLTTGRTFEIHHPDLIMVGRREAVIGITNEPTDTAFDRAAHVDLFHIVMAEPFPPPAPASSNGQQT